MESGIYKLEWENGYFYFGQTQNLRLRKIEHLSRLKKNRHENTKMQNVYNKHGIPKFIIVDKCHLHLLDQTEQIHIDLHFNNPLCCNLSPTASSQRGIKRSQETKAKISKRRSGLLLSEDHKSSISLGLLDAYQSGRKEKPDLNGVLNPFFGKKHSEDTCKLFSEQRKGRGKGGENVKAVLVLDLENGIYYDCISDAAHSVRLNPPALRKRLRRGTSSKFLKLC